MLTYGESDIFEYQNSGDAMLRRINGVLKLIGPNTVMNNALAYDIDQMTKVFKEAIVLKIVEAIKAQRIIILYIPDPAQRLPDLMPFLKVKRKGEECMIVDLSRYIMVNPDYHEDGELTIPKNRIDIVKMHDILIPAFISLQLMGATRVLPYETIRDMSIIWADMIINILSKVGIFGGNSDRREAFRYFSLIFYMKYYLQCPQAVVDSISAGVIKSAKNPIIAQMTANMKHQDANPYSSFGSFCKVMFDSEINGIVGLERSMTKILNFTYFVQQFMGMYGPEALSAFYSPDYFVYILYVAYRKDMIVRDKAFEYILGNGPKSSVMPKLMQSLYKEAM